MENPSKSEVIGRCGGDEKKRMTTQNHQIRTPKKKEKKRKEKCLRRWIWSSFKVCFTCTAVGIKPCKTLQLQNTYTCKLHKHMLTMCLFLKINVFLTFFRHIKENWSFKQVLYFCFRTTYVHCTFSAEGWCSAVVSTTEL